MLIPLMAGLSPGALQTLRLSLSSEDDLLFLHTLEVNEEDFQTLKADQGILVDFTSFPQKVVSLLQKCLDCKDETQPRYAGLHACKRSALLYECPGLLSRLLQVPCSPDLSARHQCAEGGRDE